MIRKIILAALVLVGCHRTPDNDDLQAHEQRALDILENYMEKEAIR